MTDNEIKMLTVGPDDVLFINIKGDNVDSDQIDILKKQLIKARPDLKKRVFILASSDGIDMAVVKG